MSNKQVIIVFQHKILSFLYLFKFYHYCWWWSVLCWLTSYRAFFLHSNCMFICIWLLLLRLEGVHLQTDIAVWDCAVLKHQRLHCAWFIDFGYGNKTECNRKIRIAALFFPFLCLCENNKSEYGRVTLS